MPSGYELTYYNLIPRLADCDFVAVAPQLGLSILPDGKIPISFLRREYLIGHDGVVDINGGGESDGDFNRKSVLIYYLTSGGRGEPFYQFKLLHHFSEGVFSGDRGNSNWMSDPLQKVFGEYTEKFVKAMQVLGAEQQESKAGATSVWSYQLLPKMPIEIYFYEEDEEFSCETKIMYDGTALKFVPFETLAVLNGCLISEIKSIAEII
jgi:hypothetical protein